MNDPSPHLCPGCHRPIGLRTLRAEDGETVIVTECRDCGVMFNQSQSADVDEEKLQGVSFEQTTIPARELRGAAARRKTKRRPHSNRFIIGRSAHWRR